MKNLYLDPLTNDLAVQNYQLRLTTDMTEWLSQKIENRLKLVLGEWFVNQSLGLPYFDKILKKNADIVLVNSIFLKTIKDTKITFAGQVYGVKRILDFTVDYDNSARKYTLDFRVLSTEEDIIEGGLVV
jgi:hypothetical protein